MDGGGLHKLARVLRHIAAEATSDPGEGPTGAELLVATDVFTHAPTTVGEIVTRTGVAQSQVSRIVTELKQAGILAASVDPGDRRRSLLRLAPGVRETYGRSHGRRDPRPALRNHLTRTGLPATDSDLDEVIDLMERLAAFLGAT